MATNIVYRPPSAAEWTRMATGPEIRAALASIAVRGKGIAEALSQDFRETGRYSSAFKVAEDTVVVAGHPRAAAVLLNTAPYATEVELRHHVLARTRDVLGAASL